MITQDPTTNCSSPITEFENVDKFWLVSNFTGLEGAISTNSSGIARFYNAPNVPNYPFFNATDSTHTLYRGEPCGCPVCPDSGTAHRSGSTIVFTMNIGRIRGSCPFVITCSGSATLGQ